MVPPLERSSATHVRYRARWVLPVVAPPIPGGWVDVGAGHVVAVGARGEEPGADARLGPPARVVDLGDVVVMPALVNAHTHLELSALRGRLPRVAVMTDWVRALMRERHGVPAEAAARAVDEAIGELHAWGVTAVGEVTNSLSTIDALARSPLAWRAFHEVLGFRVTDGAALVEREVARWPAVSPSREASVELAAHAPYSTSPSLIAAVAAWVEAGAQRRTTIHLAESPEESTFLRTGTGPWRDLLEALGAWSPEWRVPRTDPVSYVEGLGLLGPRTLVVHGVQLERAHIERLKARGATVVLCARSNRWIGAGDPPVGALHEIDVPVALGTDSLASVEDLGIFGELAALHRVAPDVPAAWLLRGATLGGARALGFSRLGAIEAGFAARLVAVDVPASERDVEQYLVSGVDRAAIRWVAE